MPEMNGFGVLVRDPFGRGGSSGFGVFLQKRLARVEVGFADSANSLERFTHTQRPSLQPKCIGTG